MTDAEETRALLIQDAARKQVQMFVQYDGYVGLDPGLDYGPMDTDADGDAMTRENVRPELRMSGSDLAVRIQVHADAKASDVLRILDKLRDGVARDMRDAGDMAVAEWDNLQYLRNLADFDQHFPAQRDELPE